MKTVLRTILYPFALCEINIHLYVHNDMSVSICIFQIAINLNLSNKLTGCLKKRGVVQDRPASLKLPLMQLLKPFVERIDKIAF